MIHGPSLPGPSGSNSAPRPSAGSPLLLGLDLGSSRIKALLLDGEGSDVGSASVATPFESRPEGTEMTVERLLVAVAQVLERLGDDRSRVTGVGITGMAESGAPLGGDGRPLAPVIAWHDRRGAATVAMLTQRFGDGLANQIGQPLRTVSSVAKLGWSVDHGVDGVRSWLGVPELCLLALTGAHATDYSLAARTGCYDVTRRRWLPEVVEALGLAVTVLPPIQPAGAVMGSVVAAAADWSGLAQGVPVTVAGHDHLAAFAGAGVGAGRLGNSVGTAETVVARADRVPDIDRALAAGTAVSLFPAGEAWAVFAGAARAGRVLDDAVVTLGRPLDELDRLAEGVGSVDASRWLASVEADQRRRRTGAGDGDRDEDGDGDGQDGTEGVLRPPRLPAGSPGTVWRGVLEALAGRTWEAAQRAMEVTGPASGVVVFGGGSRSRPWLRAKAEACELPVWRSTAGEAAARGAAVSAGVSVGWWPSTAAAPAAPLEAF
ncbi:MAG: FGGY family carbohydrate kinase [Acidimicrobiales bacterium]